MADGDCTSLRPCKKCGVLFLGIRCKPCKNAKSAENYAARAKQQGTIPRTLLTLAEARERRLARAKEYRENNREKVAAAIKAWRLANIDRVRAVERAAYAANLQKAREKNRKWRAQNKAYFKNWYDANLSRVKLAAAAWYAANKERHLGAALAWKALNPEKVRRYTVEWRKANPEKYRINCQNRRVRKQNGAGKLSHGLASKLVKLQRGKCACCGKSLSKGFHMDHVVPLALGGAHADWNMQLLTPKCNLQKAAKRPEQFMRQRGFLL